MQVLLNAFLPQLVTSALQERTGDIETHDDDGGNPLECLLEDIVKGIELDNGIVSQISRSVPMVDAFRNSWMYVIWFFDSVLVSSTVHVGRPDFAILVKRLLLK